MQHAPDAAAAFSSLWLESVGGGRRASIYKKSKQILTTSVTGPSGPLLHKVPVTLIIVALNDVAVTDVCVKRPLMVENYVFS